MLSDEITSYEDFFTWCSTLGLVRDLQIAQAFGRTTQTVRNWKGLPAGHPSGLMPLHLILACKGYEVSSRRTGKLVPPFPEMSITWFEMWCGAHGLDTLAGIGNAFGLTRQAVHSWHKRGQTPRWLPLACLGYEAGIPRGRAKRRG
jgi:hypothetical protein